EKVQAKVSKLQDRTAGWRFGVRFCAISTFSVCLLNLSATIWAARTPGNTGPAPGQATLFAGDCKKANTLNTWLHVLVNALGTIILASSNYCMQILSAPTRREVDRAHGKGQGLDIGILSLRNLRNISKRRTVLWSILAISSLPLHLLYDRDTIFFSDPDDNFYDPSDTYLNPSLIRAFQNASSWYEFSNYYEHVELRDLNSKKLLNRMDNAACINTLSGPFPAPEPVLVVSDNATVPAIMSFATYSGNWVCGIEFSENSNPLPCKYSTDLDYIRSHSSEWSPFPGFRVAYCLSKKLANPCKVQLHVTIAIIVTALNFTKGLIMLLLSKAFFEDPLLTLGDAVASFLENREPSTPGNSLLASERLQTDARDSHPGLRVFRFRRNFLFASSSKRRWVFTISLYISTMIVAAVYLAHAVRDLKDHLGFSGMSQVLRKIPFGQATSVTSLYLPNSSSDYAFVRMALVANTPQTVVSCLYVLYNGLFTAMSGALEWNSYARHRKGLRVSAKPKGDQKGAYFLELPYRIAIPLMVCSGVLHWLVSQAFFLATTIASFADGTPLSWSPLALLLAIVVSSLFVIILVFAGFWRLTTIIPPVANNSLAISAACHPPKSEDGWKTATSKVQWGVTGSSSQPYEPARFQIGHCSFSMDEVEPPEEGCLY
ncbi:hypothetical protein P154DRAFT_413151, partial [Amniculicola lignicola CBS 123094]